MSSITLPPEYGYVILTGVASALVASWHGINVGKYRREAKISYPQAYAPHADALTSPAKMRFNCAQRAHGNFLETYPTFLVLLCMGGIKYPVISMASGLVWLAGRVVYTLGYCTGEPSKRQKGSFQYIGLIGLLGTAGWSGVQMLMGK